MPSSAYVLKIIRDHPTDDYKFDYFDGLDEVLRKYNLVHEIDRAGSMLDNIIYSNVKLDRTMFAPELLDELLEAVAHTQDWAAFVDEPLQLWPDAVLALLRPDGAATHIVAVAEATGDHHGIETGQIALLMPEEAAGLAELALQGPAHVPVAVGAGKDDDREPHISIR